MKRYKRLGILLIVLVVVCAATLALNGYEEKKEQIQTSGERILAVPADAVQTLSWEYEDTALAFHLDEQWLYDGDEAFPVDEEAIRTLLKIFEDFHASFIIEEAEDLGQYGLDDPACTIRLTAEDQTYEIALGDISKMDAQRYVNIGDGNVYLVTEDPFESYEVVLSDLIDHDETPDFQEVTSLGFAGMENYTVTYRADSTLSYSDEDVYFTQDGNPLDTDLVESYLNNLSDLNPTDYVTYNATEAELQEYGLDAPELTVTVDDTGEDGKARTFVLHISRNPEDVSEDSGEEIPAYVRVGESQIVYQISQDEYNLLTEASYDDLRHQELFWADFAGVTQLDITLEGATHTLVSTPEDGEPVWRFPEDIPEPTETTETEAAQQTEPEEDNTLDLSAVQTALKALTADTFTDEVPADKEEIRLTIHLDNAAHPETELALYRYNGTQCLAVVNGESVSLVKRSAVMTLVEAVQTILLDH